MWKFKEGELHYRSSPLLPALSADAQSFTWHISRNYSIRARRDSADSLILYVHDMSLHKDLAQLHTNNRFPVAVSVSPDGNRLLVAFENAWVEGWAISTGQMLFSHRDTYTIYVPNAWFPSQGHIGAVFSPDAAYVALKYTKDVNFGGPTWPVRLCRVSDGMCVGVFTEHQSYVTALAFTPDGKTICYCTADGSVYFRPIGHLMK